MLGPEFSPKKGAKIPRLRAQPKTNKQTNRKNALLESSKTMLLLHIKNARMFSTMVVGQLDMNILKIEGRLLPKYTPKLTQNGS